MANGKRVFVKRAQLAGSMSYRSWEKYQEGDYVIGKVVGFFTDNYDKKGVKIQVYETGFADGTGDELIDKVLAINSCGALVQAIDEIEAMFNAQDKQKNKEDVIIRVEYTGKTQVQKGKFAGKDCHTATLDLVGEGEEEEQTQTESDL